MIYIKSGIKVILFSGGFILLLILFSELFIPKNNMEEYGMEEVEANGILGEKKNTIDVLIVGDSEAYTAISPAQIWKETGITAYVSSSSVQTLDYTYQLVKRAFKNQSPKLVILESNAVYREVPAAQAALSLLKECFPVFQYHSRWKHLNINDLTGTVNYTWTTAAKGYRGSTTINPSENKEYMQKTEHAVKVSSINSMYVKAIKKLCDKHGAKFLLLRTPSTVNWNYAMHNGIIQFAREIGCEQIDMNLGMNEIIKIDWDKDTRDKGDHLNDYGAMKVTKFVAEYLKQTKLFQDHSTDPEYAKWNETIS